MKQLVIVFIIFLLPNCLKAQEIKSLIAESVLLEKSGLYENALVKYEEILKLYPNNEIAICKSSELNATIGDFTESNPARKKYFEKAYSLAKKCIILYPNSAEANYVFGMSMAKLTDVVSVKEKMKYVKEIKKYAEKALLINNNHVLSLYLLGKWHLEICNLSFTEKTAVNLLFGGLPNASLSEAISNFEKIKKLNPYFIANYVELAKSYHINNNPQLAKDILKSVAKIDIRTANDSIYKIQALKLLDQYNKFK